MIPENLGLTERRAKYLILIWNCLMIIRITKRLLYHWATPALIYWFPSESGAFLKAPKLSVIQPGSEKCFLKHEFPGTFKENKLSALVLPGALRAFREAFLGFQMADEFHLVAETRRGPFFLLLLHLQWIHLKNILPQIQNHFKIFWKYLRLIYRVCFVKLWWLMASQ